VNGKTGWNVVAGFHAFIGWLVEVEQIAAVPKITWPKKPRSNPATIGPSTQRAILDAIPEEKRGVFLAMALLCIRPSEAVEMASRQLRGDGWITVDVSRADRSVYSGTKAVKNEEPRTLPIPDELAEWIERWVPRERRLAGALLFVNPNTGGPWGRRRRSSAPGTRPAIRSACASRSTAGRSTRSGHRGVRRASGSRRAARPGGAARWPSVDVPPVFLQEEIELATN
jgi:integrase